MATLYVRKSSVLQNMRHYILIHDSSHDTLFAAEWSKLDRTGNATCTGWENRQLYKQNVLKGVLSQIYTFIINCFVAITGTV